MSGLLKLKAEAGGSVILAANSAATTDYTLTLPGANTVFVGTDLAQPLSNKTITNSTLAGGSITLGTSVTASGTSVDFTGVPSWVRRITVTFNGVSTNGSSNIQLQIGSGSAESSGYLGSSGLVYGTAQCVVLYGTTGAVIYENQAADLRHGSLTITNMGSNVWIISGIVASSTSGGGCGTVAYSKTTSGVLDRVRITTVNGTDTFDAGTFNIIYE